MRATFKGGYTLAFYKADVDDRRGAGDLAQPAERPDGRPTSTTSRLAGDYVIFPVRASAADAAGGAHAAAAAAEPARRGAGRGRPVPWTNGTATTRSTSWTSSARPVLLTTTDGLIEDQTSVAVSARRQDLLLLHERARTSSAATSGPCRSAAARPCRSPRARASRRIPTPLASGKYLATLSADWKMPQSLGVWKLGAAAAARRDAEDRLPDVAAGLPDGRAREAADRDHEGRRRPRDPQPALPAEGPEARRAAPGDRLRARRTGAADAARLSLHAVLSLGLRHQSVARQPGLRRDVDQLPQRHRLRPVVPQRAEHRRRRATRVPGRAGGRQVPADAAGRRSEPHRHLGPVVRRRAHVAGAGAQLRHLQGRRRSRRRAPVGQLARSGVGVVQVVDDWRDRRLEVAGAARSRATTTATSRSSR